MSLSLEERVTGAIKRALGIKVNQDRLLRMGSTPGWDSLGHMNVVMEIEQEFNVSFPQYRLHDLVDQQSIVTVLKTMHA